MGITIPLLARGFLFLIIGMALLVIWQQRVIGVSCSIMGLVLIIVPPILIMLSSM